MKTVAFLLAVLGVVEAMAAGPQAVAASLPGAVRRRDLGCGHYARVSDSAEWISESKSGIAGRETTDLGQGAGSRDD